MPPPLTSTWNKEDAIRYLNLHARPTSLGRCAEYTRRAIEAGGVTLQRTISAKDYGASLQQAGFVPLGQTTSGYEAGDVVVIQPIPGHPDGHMAMYNGSGWVSDFRQLHGLYPGPGYRNQHPSFSVYRFRDLWTGANQSATDNAQ